MFVGNPKGNLEMNGVYWEATSTPNPTFVPEILTQYLFIQNILIAFW